MAQWEQAIQRVKDGDAVGASALIGPCDAAWADKAEAELAPALGADPPVLNARPKGPRHAWNEPLGRDFQMRDPDLHAVRWLSSQARALTSLRPGDRGHGDRALKLVSFLDEPPASIKVPGDLRPLFGAAANFARAEQVLQGSPGQDLRFQFDAALDGVSMAACRDCHKSRQAWIREGIDAGA